MNEKKLDIFRTLAAIDQRDYSFFEKLDDEEKKAFVPFIVARWMSSAPDQGGLHAYYLTVTNEMVNKNLWSLSQHPELVWNQMAACGAGQKKRHEWIKGPVRGTKSKIDEFLKTLFFGVNQHELRIIKNKLDEKTFRELLQEYAYTEKDEKELVKQFKKERK